MWHDHVFFAYVDPTTGSYLLQLALAGVLAAGYALRTFWARIVQFFARQSPSRADDPER